MGKIYGKLFSIFLLSLISMSLHVAAEPTGAATCKIDSKDIEGGHGPSKLSSPGGYKLTTAMKSVGSFEFTLSGPGNGYQGVLAYVLDGSGKRVGKFVSLPEGIRIKNDCGDGEAEPVTHTSSDSKPFPISLVWNAPQGTTGNLTVRALVAKDQADYSRLDAVQIDPVTGASNSPTGNLPTNTQQNTQSDGFLQKYSLFLAMAGITTLLYVVGSVTEAMLKRQQVKSRSFAKTINNGFGNSSR